MESWSLSTNTELSETSTTQTGTSRTYRGHRNTFSISCNGLCSFDSNHSVPTMRVLQQQFSVIPVSIVEIDDNGNGATFTGNVIITVVTNNTSASDFENYSIEATGTGDWIYTEIPIDPNENCQDEWYYYTANGSEGTAVVISLLKGVSIAGRIYRDGLEYRPSGVDHDGTGVPVGKQFKFDPATGGISFDANIIGLALGEQVDIPYNLCGSGGAQCLISIKNVSVVYDDDNSRFILSFEPVVDNITTVPEGVKIRYSIDDGETWQVTDNITYDPVTDYNHVTINDTLEKNQNYIFEITPECNGSVGTPGIGYYFHCVNANWASGTPILPDATIGAAYNSSYRLNGSAPFTLADVIKPDWLSINIVYSGTYYNVVFSGTPISGDIGSDVPISFSINNCSIGELVFNGTMNVLSHPLHSVILNYDYSNLMPSGGYFDIKVNGISILNITATNSGVVYADPGDNVLITVQASPSSTAQISVTGDYTGSTSQTYNAFLLVSSVSSGTYNITGISND